VESLAQECRVERIIRKPVWHRDEPGDRNAMLQAGREIRIFVKPEDIDDLASVRLARDIAKQIEESMQYPGQIKVTVIREMRAIDYAK
jgi:ribonuclease Y